jgi:uncharacterized membrane protein
MTEKKKLSTSIKQIFLSGLLAILPIGITVWIIVKAVELGDSFLGAYIRKITPSNIPAIGLIATVILIFLVGLLVHGYIGKHIRSWIEILFLKTPIIKSIYKPIRDIVENFSSPNNENFKTVVMVNYPNEHTKSMGFVTKQKVELENNDLTAVFIPTTPNPTNGFLVYFKKEDLTEIGIPVDEALKIIISLGSTTPEILLKKQGIL